MEPTVNLCLWKKKPFNLTEVLNRDFPNLLSEETSRTINGYTAEIIVKDNIQHIFHKAYSVPFALRPQVEEELNNLVSQGVIYPVTHSSFASPIVVAPKPDNSIRICMVCKNTINKFELTKKIVEYQEHISKIIMHHCSNNIELKPNSRINEFYVLLYPQYLF